MIKYLVICFLFGQIFQITASQNHLTDNVSFQDSALLDSCSPKWTMPLVKLGEKFYYIGTFYKISWYKAYQFCQFHGLQLASVTSSEENEVLIKYLLDLGFQASYWLSGTDLGSEGQFFWMSSGHAVKYGDWWPRQPDNYVAPNNETENCLCLWNRYGNEIKWNDSVCSNNLYFICELQQ